MRSVSLSMLAAFGLWAGVASAQDMEAQYSPDEFVRAILSGPQPCPPGRTVEQCEANPKTRRFTLAKPPAQPAPVRTRRQPRLMSLFAKPSKVTSSDVLVTFATGSADITPQGQANLRSIAAGLNKAALAQLTFEVAGFTDVTGPAALNRTLSLRRAEAVKAFLIAHDVAPARLTAAGYGSEHLADPDDPASEANRRVELHRLN